MKKCKKRAISSLFKMLFVFVAFLLFGGASVAIILFRDTTTLSTGIVYSIFSAAFISLVLFVWSIIPHIKRSSITSIRRSLSTRSSFLAKFFDDASFRATYGIYSSLFFNSILAMWRGWTGIIFSSYWFVLLGCYYLMAAVVRFLLVKSGCRRKTLEKKRQSIYSWKTYRLIGIFTLLLTFFLQLTVFHIVMTGNGHSYEGVWIYAVAFYDFFCLAKEITQLIRGRKASDPILKAMRVVRFLTAMGAMLALQTAMFASFGVEAEQSFQQIMNATSGTVICLISLFIGFRMIITGTKELARVMEEYQMT